MANFPYYYAIIGGILIGISTSIMMGLLGRICGISRFIFRLTTPSSPLFIQNLIFIVGLVFGSYLASFHFLKSESITINASYPQIIIAGLLVGIGTQVGKGCTSGHGICGVARFSPRSIVATAIFMSLAIITTYIIRHF